MGTLSILFRKLIFPTLWAACLAASWCQITPAAAVALVVDAATTLQESDGDDLATLKNIFQSANAPHDFASLAPIDQTITDLKLKRMRVLQADVYSDLDGNGQFIPAPPGIWDNLTSHITWALQRGLSPHVPVATYMPQSFVTYGAAETWSVDTMSRYKSYARQLVRYIVQLTLDNGGTSLIFEVSNEIDIADDVPLNFTPPNPDPAQFALLPLGPWGRFLWWIDPASYDLHSWTNGYPFGRDPRRVPHGIAPMQKIFVDAVDAVKPDFPQMTIEIGGPAMSSVTFETAATQPTLEESFLDHMFDPMVASGQFNVSRLDYVSFHYYGDFRDGWNGPTTTLRYVTDRLRAKVAALGHPEAKLFLSEWGPSNDLSSDINYSHKGAAWTAAFLTEAVAAKVAIGSYLLMDDAIGNDATGSKGIPSFVAKIDSVNYPKPPANVFKMFAMMSGTRRPVAGLSAANPNLGAFAASDASSAGIVVFNYNGAFTDTPETFSVQLDNLPFTGTVTVERYLVDAQTSNLQAYLTQPGQPHPSLQRVEQFPVDVVQLPNGSGQLILPQRTLGLGVTYWRVVF